MRDEMHPAMKPLTQRQRVLVGMIVLAKIEGTAEFERAVERMDKEALFDLWSGVVEEVIAEAKGSVGWLGD